MSNDSIAPARVSATIYAGATFRKGWTRLLGEDRQPDDYTGCTAIGELRDATTDALLGTFSSSAGATGLILTAGPRLELYLSPLASKALSPFTSAICHVELRRPWGDIERLYEVEFFYSAEKTQAEPPIP